MARSLEGKWFHNCYNNGVEAVVSHEIWENIEKRYAIVRALGLLEDVREKIVWKEDILPHLPEMPIFTFASTDRVTKSPWLTGTRSSEDRENDLHRLLNYITKNGGWFSNIPFYVPFSNGAEMGLHGPKAQLSELRYVTTNSQFEETFGVSLDELRASGDKYL